MAQQAFPKISVVIPNYNHADCLRAALASACYQEPQPHEVLVFDDCSTDNSVAVVEAFAKRFAFVQCLRYPRKSIYWQKAWFDNVHLASGEWVLALSADDLIYPGFIKAVGQMASQYPQCGIVTADVEIVSNKQGVMGLRRARFGKPCFLEGEQIRNQLRQFRASECGSGTIIRKDALLWLGKNNVTDMGPWCDSIGYPVVAMKHGACYVPEVLGAVGFDDDKPTWSQKFMQDTPRALETFDHVAKFLRSREVAAVVPVDVVLALEYKILVTLPPECQTTLLPCLLRKHVQELISFGHVEHADQFLRGLLPLFPHHAQMHADWGLVQFRLGRIADAETACRKALELDPSITQAHATLAQMQQQLGHAALESQPRL